MRDPRIIVNIIFAAAGAAVGLYKADFPFMLACLGCLAWVIGAGLLTDENEKLKREIWKLKNEKA